MIKKLLLSAALMIVFNAPTFAQSNCDLINSATFSVPVGTQTLQGFELPCVNNATPPNNSGTQVNVSIPIGQWSYVALTKSSANQCELFLNGQSVFVGNYANITYAWNRLVLGSQLFGGAYSNFFNGSIDEVRISNSVRSPIDILNYFNSNAPFVSDANTIGLWHFDQTSGTTVNATTGVNGITNANWSPGVFGNALSYNGTSEHSDFLFTTPTTNSTIELWIKPNVLARSWPIMTYGANSSGLLLNPYATNINYSWSTGATGNSITVDPTTLPYIWVTDGNCTDTIWFNSQSVTVVDTVYVTVTDTLFINTSVTGINPPNNVNTIRVFPNPATTHVTIDYGSFSIMTGYQLRIENSLGQQVYLTSINQQSDYLSLATWGGNGLYFVHIIDPQGNTIDIRKIVLQ